MTIPLDPRFIPAFSIEDVLLDKDTGAPLSGGLVYFEYDNQRGLLKPVYQITGTSPNYSFIQLSNPVVLSSIGTFEDSLGNPVIPYFFPYKANGDVELYYVRVTNANDVPQFAREAQPYVFVQNEDQFQSLITNELSNPQFIDVLFDTASGTYTYNVTAATDLVIPIAPDWDLVASGTVGSVTLAQNKPQGTLNIITNPGTLLTLGSTGLTKLHLRQRIYGSPNLWGSGYLSGSFVAKTYGGTTVDLNMYYSQSDGAVVDQLIATGALSNTGDYDQYFGNILIPSSDSTENYPDAYVDIYFDIPLSIQIDITSVMVSYTGAVSIETVDYDQETNARQTDHLFHYYKPQLEFKPIPSFLIGWDFPMNPAQFTPTGNISNTTAAYIWDQTIAKSVVGNCAYLRNTVTSGLQVTTGNANEAFYFLQYLSGRDAQQLLGNRLAVNVNAFRTQAAGVCNVKVYLYRGSSTATFPVLPISLGTIDAAGVFSLTASDWSLIPRDKFGQAEGSLSTVNTGNYDTLNDVEDLKFNGWEIVDTAKIADTDKFAIVVTFSCPTTATVVVANSISLVAGDIPTRPAPMSTTETLLGCQKYYEKSYAPEVAPGTASSVGAMFAQQIGKDVSSISINVEIEGFGWPFKSYKRTATPTVALYSPTTGTAAQVRLFLRNGGAAVSDADVAATLWTQTLLGSTGVTYIPNSVSPQLSTAATGNHQQGYMQFHYTVDARLGVVA